MNSLQILLTATLFLFGGMMVRSGGLAAQNLVVNPGFSNGATGWNASCAVEINPETVYGGTNGSNPVSEIDVERCIAQQVNTNPGTIYDFSFRAGRRQGGSTPASVGIRVRITGVPSGVSFVDFNRVYTNNSWEFSAESLTFTIPANSTDTKVEIRFSNYLTAGTYGTLVDDITLSINPLSGTLPLKLNSFTGSVKDSEAILTWSAENSDRDGRHFVIERSAGSASGKFDSIGVHTVTSKKYSFTDRQMLPGVNYYRLRIVNETLTNYSKVLTLSANAGQVLKTYPNPAITNLSYVFESPAPGAVNVVVYSLAGTVASKSLIMADAGVNNRMIDIYSLAPGTYFLKLHDGKGLNLVRKFQKK